MNAPEPLDDTCLDEGLEVECVPEPQNAGAAVPDRDRAVDLTGVVITTDLDPVPPGTEVGDVHRRRIKVDSVGRTRAVALQGITGTLISVETSVNAGLPGIDIVGLPDASVNESRQRIRAALSNMGYTLSQSRFTINLSPGTVRKVGTGFDLATAMSILAAEGSVDRETCAEIVFVGELGLDSRVHPVTGVLPVVLAGLDAGIRRFVVPAANLVEARVALETATATDTGPSARVRGAATLAQAVNLVGGDLPEPELPALEAPVTRRRSSLQVHDLSEVRGQADARWALEVAAAGGHHMYMVGAPGAGKTLLAQCLPGILPPLDPRRACEVAALSSVDGTFDPGHGLALVPPFESPHHRASASAMVGGSRPGVIGAFSRAHHGVLFLDEAPEFSRDVLEALRQPVESGLCDIHRAWGSVVLPARFQLVLAANPCPCGQAAFRNCSCTPADKRRYRTKLSGPVLDRVDIQLDVLPVTLADLRASTTVEDSATVAARVREARARQEARYRGEPWDINAHAPGPWLREHFDLGAGHLGPLDSALERGQISMRGYDRVVRVATTLADLDGREGPSGDDLLSALTLRTREER